MSCIARFVYKGLLWRERRRARKPSGMRQNSVNRSEHLETGRRGETLAYWFLRRAGYTIVARNRRARSGSGELDLVGWDGPVLAFVEVKTRTSAEAGLPEAAVTGSKQKRVGKAAQEYLHRLGRKRVNYRFDIVSVFWEPGRGYDLRLIKDAFKA